MAEIDLGSYVTLIDVANAYKDSQLIYIANTMSRNNPIIQDAPYQQANQMTTHIGGRDKNIPEPGTRRYNEGVTPSKYTQEPVTEAMCMIEDYMEVDYELYKVQPQPEAWRQRQDTKKMSAFPKKFAKLLFTSSGNLAVDPTVINGLLTRFNSLTHRPNSDTEWDYNVWDNGGTSSGYMTSIWLIEWEMDECMFIYPRGSQAGVFFEDKGQITKEESGNKMHEVLRSHYIWKPGLFVGDERRVQRVCNICTTGTTSLFDDDLLIKAKNMLPGMGDAPKTFIYCNRTIRSQMDIRYKDKNNVNYSVADMSGVPTLRFQGIPVHVCDGITNTEPTVS